MNKASHWVKNVIQKCNPIAGVVHIKKKNPAFYRVLGCFNPNLGRIWTNPNVGLKM